MAMLMEGQGRMEKLFEQPDLSIDVRDNGRINLSLVSLNLDSTELVDDITVYLSSLPPFKHEDSNAFLSLRIITGMPYWAREKKGESEGLLNGSKKVYCLFCVAKCKDIDDLTNVSSQYDKQLRQCSTNPLMVTRCLVFGSGSVLTDELKGKNGFILIDAPLSENRLSPAIESQLLKLTRHCVTVVYSNITILLGDKKSQKKAGSLPHVADVTLDDEETRRQQGRSCKAQGDYHLLLGDHSKAKELYREGLAIFEKKDSLWLGAILESMLTITLLRKSLSSPVSSSGNNPSSTSIMFELSIAIDGGRNTPPVNKMSTSQDLPDKPHPLSNKPHPLSMGNNKESSSSLVDGSHDIDGGGMTDVTDDKVEKVFQVAIQHYSKAGSIGKKPLLELLLKYAGHLVHHEKNFEAACKQLHEAQIVLSSEPSLFEPLQLSLYLTLSKLYHSMSLKRKTLFMMFNAGREACKMSAYNLHYYGDLQQKAFQILTHSLKEFGIVSELKDEGRMSPVRIKGWPLLQAAVLMEYINLCLKMNHYHILIKRAWLCLQTFHSYLTPNDVSALADNIAKSVGKIKENSGNDDVHVSVPSNVSSIIPSISLLKPQTLAPSLSVKQSKTLFPSKQASAENEGPFIYSAMNKKPKGEVLWVQGDPAEVLLEMSNPLPLELKVERMMVNLEGAEVNTYPSTIALPASCIEPQQFVLLCIPAEPGNLSLKGYSASIFGLLNSPSLSVDAIIKVLPSLPQLRAKILPKVPVTSPPHNNNNIASSFSKRSMSKDSVHCKTVTSNFDLMDGEVYECILQFQSIGDVSVDNIKISVAENDSSYCKVCWDRAQLQSIVPMKIKNKTEDLSLNINVTMPVAQRIGPCKASESHISRSVLRRQFSKPKKEALAIDSNPRSLTLAPGTRKSTEINSRELSKSPSPLTSPRRLQGRITGSFRRGKKSESESKDTNSKRSSLLESLDLHKVAEAKSSSQSEDDSSRPNSSGPTIDIEPSSSNTKPMLHVPHLRDASNSPTPSSRNKYSSLKRPLKKFKLKGGALPSLENPKLSKKISTSSSPNCNLSPLSSPVPVPNNRFLESLNIDTNPVIGSASSQNDTSLDSALSDSNTDTTSDIVDFERASGDRVSITSDPGMLVNSQTPKSSGGNTSHFVMKSSTMSFDKERKIIESSDVIKKSNKSNTVGKKKPLGPLQSVPLSPSSSGSIHSAIARVPRLSISGSTRTGYLKKKNLALSYLIQYTGGEGAKEGYYREVSVDFKITIRAVLYFFDFSVIPVKGSADKFSFEFMIENLTHDALEVTTTVDQEGSTDNRIDLEPQTSRQVVIPMKRFTLEDHEATLHESNLLKPYCDRLISLIKIKWFSPGQHKTGHLTLTGLRLPQSVVASIRPLPVIFSYKTEAMAYIPGVPVSVIIDITNNTECTLPPSAISLRPYTLSSDGTRVDCIRARTILHSQSLVQWLPELSVDLPYKLILNMVFLRQDEYCIDIVLHKKKEEETNSIAMATTASTRGGTATDLKTYKRRPSIIDGSEIQPVNKSKPLESDFNSKRDVTMMKNASLGNIREFIAQSKAYAGPQLTIKIAKP